MDYFLAVFWGNNLINLARVRESILANPSTGSKVGIRVRIIAVGRQPLKDGGPQERSQWEAVLVESAALK